MNEEWLLFITEMTIRFGIGRFGVVGVMCSVSMFDNWSIRLQW